MKKIALFFTIFTILFSCKNDNKTVEDKIVKETKETAYRSFGMEINDADALSSERMMVHYKGMKAGDTINAKMRGEIIKVCPKKGCWMTLNMNEGNEVMVRFKDYEFFVPLDAKGEVVVNGKAFVTETSVDELQHYAEDDGKSADEIAKITAPKLEYKFLADGVLLKTE